MRDSPSNSIVVLILIAYLLSGCATSSQGNKGGTPPEFQPLLGKWLHLGIKHDDILEITAVSATGEVDVTCYILKKTLLLEGEREHIGHLLPRYRNSGVAQAKIVEDGDIKFFVEFDDPAFPWANFDLILRSSRSDLLDGAGLWKADGRRRIQMFERR